MLNNDKMNERSAAWVTITFMKESFPIANISVKVKSHFLNPSMSMGAPVTFSNRCNHSGVPQREITPPRVNQMGVHVVSPRDLFPSWTSCDQQLLLLFSTFGDLHLLPPAEPLL